MKVATEVMISRRLISTLLQNARVSSQLTPVRHHNFDGETYSKTNLVLMTKEDDTHNYIEAFSPMGFRLTSGFRVLGPCAIFPKSVLHWNVPTSEKITPESLSLFCLLEPKLDILLIGIGDRGSSYDKDIIKYLRSKRINVEILPTEQACSTFNFLNSERRVVAAALIPPKDIEVPEGDVMFNDSDSVASFDDKEEDINPDSPEVTQTMKSFHKKGIVGTVSDIERNRKRSSPDFRHEDENSSPSDEKPR